LRRALKNVFSKSRNRAETRPLKNRQKLTGEVVIRPARYSFLQLAAWRDGVVQYVPEVAGIHTIGIDKAANSILIGVTDADAKSAANRVATTLGVPSDALVILVRPAERNFSTLSDYAPNGLFLGGLRIESYSSGSLYAVCNIGYNANSGQAFLTNSHCTGYRGPDPASDLTVFFQPDGGGAYIRNEADDPAYFSNFINSYCPSAEPVCRWSDAAQVNYTSATAPGSAGQGLIYRTTFASGTFGQSGSTEISGTLTINSTADYPVQGLELDKIGAATGWTYGNVSQTCMDVYSEGYYFLCQDFVVATGTFGDSGSPVFQFNGDVVTFYGLLRGGAPDHYSFSSYGNIGSDFGIAPSPVRY